MKKTNLKVLLVALSSVFALAACNSGSSSNPSPAPSPSPTVSPTVSPTPTTTPPAPVVTESGVYALNSGYIGAVFSTAPSTGAWTNYYSGATYNGGTVAAASVGISATSAGIVSIDTAGNVWASTAAGGQFTKTGSITAAGLTSATIVAGGTNAVVHANATAQAVYSLTPAGVATAVTEYYDLNGDVRTLTPLATTIVKNFGGTYYMYDTTLADATTNVLTSTDGVNWQETASTTPAGITNIVEVSSGVYAAFDSATGVITLGASPTAASVVFTPKANNGSAVAGALIAGAIASGPSGTLFVSTTTTTYVYSQLTAATTSASSIASGTGTFSNLLAAGSNVYAFTAAAANAVKPVTYNVGTGQITYATAMSNVKTSAATLATVSGSNIVLANVDTSNTAVVSGEVAVVSAVGSTGIATQQTLPIGATVTMEGFAGTPSGYMMLLSDGAVVAYSASGYVPVATIVDSTTAATPVAAQFSNGAGSVFASNGSAYAAVDTTGNLYYSANGSSWTEVLAADLPTGNTSVSTVTSAGGLFYITTNAYTYETATPADTSTWVRVSGTPIQSRMSYWNGTYYTFTNNTTNVGVYDPATGQVVYHNGVLPQLSNTINVSYNGSEFAEAQVGSYYMWTSADLIGGISGWTQNTATFSGINGVSLSDTFGSTLVWTGKVFVANNNGGNKLYTSTDGKAFAAQTYTNAGTTYYITNASNVNLF